MDTGSSRIAGSTLGMDEADLIRAAQAGDRGNVDDAACPPREHLPSQVAAGQERSQQVDVHDALPLLGGRVLGGLDQADAGIVDQNVDRRPTRFLGLLDQPIDIGGNRQIARGDRGALFRRQRPPLRPRQRRTL